MIELIDAAENVVIAYGMGWDLNGVVERLSEALAKLHETAPPPNEPGLSTVNMGDFS